MSWLRWLFGKRWIDRPEFPGEPIVPYRPAAPHPLAEADTKLVEAMGGEADRLLSELLISFDDLDPDDWIPVREFMFGVARISGAEISVEEYFALPAWETVGWFRARIREKFAALAQGLGPTVGDADTPRTPLQAQDVFLPPRA